LGPAPAEGDVANDGTAYDAACEWSNDDGEGGDADFLAFFVAEELRRVSEKGLQWNSTSAHDIPNAGWSQTPESRATKPLDDSPDHTSPISIRAGYNDRSHNCNDITYQHHWPSTYEMTHRAP
jgi:hypothetical protein